MITDNGKMVFQTIASDASVNFKNMNNVTFNQGSSLNVAKAFCGTNMQSPNSVKTLPTGTATIEVGFGDTAESASDYNLADPNFDNPQLSVSAYGKNAIALGDILNVYGNFRNNGGTNVVVKEIGIFANPAGITSSSGSYTILTFRKVLDTPITIAPGETYSFSYNVRFKS